jgi:hypothetical protein
VLGSPDGTMRDPTYEDTKDMPVMDACIRETLRMVSARFFVIEGYLGDGTPRVRLCTSATGPPPF